MDHQAEITRGSSVLSEQSYWKIVRKQFRKNRLAVWASRVILTLFVIALLADFIANEKPIYCSINGNSHWPIFKSYLVESGLVNWPPELANYQWLEGTYEKVWRAPIPYSAHSQDMANYSLTGPFDEQEVRSWRFWHWLGTDGQGRDVAAGLVHGTRVSMFIGILAMAVAALIGILLGSLAGYFGDEHFKISRARLLLNLLGLPLAIFYAFGTRSYVLLESENFGWQMLVSVFLFFVFLLVVNGLVYILKRIPALNKKVTLAIDIIVMRVIEVMNAIPNLLLLLAILVVIPRPTIWSVMVIIGLISWTTIARFVRAEMIRVRSLEYMQAAQALGFGQWRIIFRHALPNVLTPVLITIVFGIAAAILLEAFLSFLGLGVGIDQITWGRLLSLARNNFSAWWLALFPGLAIFVTVIAFNFVGEGLTDAMDPRLKK